LGFSQSREGAKGVSCEGAKNFLGFLAKPQNVFLAKPLRRKMIMGLLAKAQNQFISVYLQPSTALSGWVVKPQFGKSQF
jgi:hypothetical protein